MSLTDLYVPTCRQMLTALAVWLDKAAGCEMFTSEPDKLMALRLAPDMYPVFSQVLFTCFQAQEPLFLLRGQDVPDDVVGLSQRAYDARNQPGTFDEAMNHVAHGIMVFDGLPGDVLDGRDNTDIDIEFPDGLKFDFKGDAYVRDLALPQFYFHLTAVYAILRHYGVPLGKGDYVAHIMNHVRPESLPNG